MHTVSRKSERLVNLTIALLATKRYLTKSEIFRTVAGYSGDAEAKDRMFERDKDDLRSLGIEIELGSFDPLFEDEAGYRIKAENYQLQLSDIDATDIALLSQAGKVWREAALGESAQSGLRKLKALGIEADVDLLTEISPSTLSAPEQLEDIIEAITERRIITFEYLNSDLASTVRKIEPYRLSNSRGYWYVIGRDTEKESLRTFRLDRFTSSVSQGTRSGAFEVDLVALDEEEMKNEEKFSTARIEVRKGKGANLRSGAKVSEIDSEWDELEVQFLTPEHIIQEVLWVGENAIIVEPQELRETLISHLREVAANHG